MPARSPAMPANVRSAAALASVVVLIVVLAGCSSPSLKLEETLSFRDASHRQTVEAQVGPEIEKLELSLDLQVESGTVAFEVTDPFGKVVWRGDVTGGGRLSDGRELPPVQGRWRLDLDLQQATGRYEALWVGR